MSKLERIKQGNFTLDSSFTLEQIENNNFSLLSIAEALKEYPSIIVTNELEEKIKNGNLLYNDYERDNSIGLRRTGCAFARTVPVVQRNEYELQYVVAAVLRTGNARRHGKCRRGVFRR